MPRPPFLRIWSLMVVLFWGNNSIYVLTMTAAPVHLSMYCKALQVSLFDSIYVAPDSTMHQSLQHVVDIVRPVAKEVVNLEHPSTISLACTCRTFEAAVMEILWGSHQTDLVELLRCFPNELWEVRESDGGKLYFLWTKLPHWCCPMRADSWMFVVS